MSGRFGAALVLCLLASTVPAWAHSPIMGIGGLFGGVLHAVLIPEHGLGLLALGLVLGQQPSARRRAALLIFSATLAGGLIATAFAIGEAHAADVLLMAAGIMGLLIAAAWAPPFLGWSLAAIAGLFLALDSRPEVTSNDEAIRMLIGSGLGAVFALALVSETSFILRGKAALIVSRVVGSWIAAISILVLSLRIATQMSIG
jgi:urease accessory protein